VLSGRLWYRILFKCLLVRGFHNVIFYFAHCIAGDTQKAYEYAVRCNVIIVSNFNAPCTGTAPEF
jgi:hypothetical protein